MESAAPATSTSIPARQLPEEVLARSRSLPLKPAAVTLRGRHVVLAPLELERDAYPLYQVSDGRALQFGDRRVDAYDPDELIWRYMPRGPFASVADLAASLLQQVEAPDGLCLCVFDAEGRQVGVVNYLNNQPAHLKVELGSIWYSPIAQRTGANREAAYLLLRHAFALGYRRVEWKCDALNLRSRRAAEGIGFSFEGIQEQHFIVKGRNRDTAWFRVLDREWPLVRARLEC